MKAMQRNTMGLSILAGGLAFIGSASATDLIVNGSFEIPLGDPGAGWTGHFRTYNFSAAYYAGPAIPASESPGDNYSWQHGSADGVYTEPCLQMVDLTQGVPAAEIDAGRGQYVFSSWLASYTDNPDQPYVTLTFLDGVSNQLGNPIVLDRATTTFWAGNADAADMTPPSAENHHWAKYEKSGLIPQTARNARVALTRSPNAGLSGTPDSYMDLVKLDVTLAPPRVPPSLESTTPGNGATGLRPDAIVRTVLRDGTTQVDTNSLQFSFDGLPVIPSIEKTDAITTIQYDPPGALGPLSAHRYALIFDDTGDPVIRQTNEVVFTVARFYDILLPSPIYLETFDSTPEGMLPTGWTSFGFSGQTDPDCDPLAPDIGGLQDLHSACYTNWIVVNSARFNSNMLTYPSHTPETDYRRVLSTNPANWVNGAFVENLAQGNIVFGNSGYQDDTASQVVYLFSPDFDLTGQTNVYLSFHSLWEQNQDSIGAVEYSIDQGATWLPIVYLLDGLDIIRDAQGAIDAVATLGTARVGGFQGQATYLDPVTSEIVGGHYGAFIGVDSNRWAGLGPFFSARVDDNPVESKRVEIFRLPSADNQPGVRFRLTHAGTDSWYFGIDNFGLYSIEAVNPPLVAVQPTNQVEAVGNTVLFQADVFGLGPFTFQWQRNGVDLINQTNMTLAITNLLFTHAGNYSLVVGYPGGFTSGPPALLMVIEPAQALVTGQWDFQNFDLSATCGHPLEFSDFAVELDTGFSEAEFFGIPGIDGQTVTVMNFPGLLSGGGTMSGYRMRHGILPNGGGTNVNKYTLIMDIYYAATSHDQERALLQSHPTNADNRDIAIGANNGIGVSDGFEGMFRADTWQRIAFAVDLTGPGLNPVMAKFINGVKVGQQILSEGRDRRWSLQPATETDAPWALLFADDTIEVAPGYVSSIQIRGDRLSDELIARLGGPSPHKIPGCIRIDRENGDLVVHWTGGVPLESAENIHGPWSVVDGAADPYSVPTGQSARFYRPKL